MRKSFNETGWVEDENHIFLGVALGFDFCAEHEEGAKSLACDFDIPTEGMGFPRLCARAVPEQVLFEEWTVTPKSRRGRAAPKMTVEGAAAPKKKKAPVPKEQMAALFIGGRSYGEPLTARTQAEQNVWMCEKNFSLYDPDKHDIAAAWDSAEAVVQVRGEENIARLRQVYEAILSRDLVFNAPVQSGFTHRGGLSLGIASHFSQAFHDEILSVDQASERLEKAVVASGIRDLLKVKEIGYYALSPTWIDKENERGLLFFLKPQEQKKNNSGWFTLEELQAWSKGLGPIVKDERLIQKTKEFTEAHNGPKHLFVVTAQKVGWSSSFSRVCWADPEKTRLGIFLLPSAPAPGRLPSGVYDLGNFLASPPLPPSIASSQKHSKPKMG